MTVVVVRVVGRAREVVFVVVVVVVFVLGVVVVVVVQNGEISQIIREEFGV